MCKLFFAFCAKCIANLCFLNNESPFWTLFMTASRANGDSIRQEL